MEKLLIKELQTQDPEFGYNISAGGETHTISEEARQRMSDRMKGENNPCFGKVYTEEEKAKLSERMSGERNPNYGHKHTEDARRKMSEVNIGRHPTDETLRKISEALKGKLAGRPRPDGAGRPSRKVLCVETGEVFDSIADAARAKNIYKSKTRIGDVCKKKAITCGGYHWEYYESSVS